MRVGIGYDTHPLVEGRKLVIGGVEIPYLKGLQGHSDGDVLLHALCDALLGAIGKGDIGEHFPSNDPAYKDISSIKLLQEVVKMVDGSGYILENIDTIVVCEEPRLSPFKEKMKEKIAEVLEINAHKINIKATTTEGLGPLGKGEAISSYAIVALKEKR